MLSPSGWYVAVAPVDLRCGIDRLLGQVAALGRDVRDGGAYLFRNRAGTRMKVLCVDGQGAWLCVRRLHQGSFRWPRADEAVWTLSAEQFQWLAAGVDWQRLSSQRMALPALL